MKHSFLFIIVIILLVGCRPKVHPLTNSWEKAIPNQEIPRGLNSLSAEHCGTCHVQHYEEWKLSTHAHAWTDLQFQAELKKESSPYLCINCHIPLQNQQEFIVTGLVDGDVYQPVKQPNPKYDHALKQEGINCASCHVRNNVIVGPTGSTKAPHATVKDPEFLSESLCISCHNATAVVTPSLACSFETGDEWKAGPYADHKTCIDCHMESVTREVVEGYGKRASRRHYFPGSGIPKFDTVKSISLNGMGYYPGDFKLSYQAQDSLHYQLTLVNESAGHKLPSGDPERFYLINFKLTNSADSILMEKTERIGEQWQWYPEAKKLSDNNMLPLERRTYQFDYQSMKSDELRLDVIVTKHRMNQESADYNKLGEDYPLFITEFEKTYNILIE